MAKEEGRADLVLLAKSLAKSLLRTNQVKKPTDEETLIGRVSASLPTKTVIETNKGTRRDSVIDYDGKKDD